ANTELIEALDAELDGFYAEVFGEGPNSIMSILGTYANQIAELQAKVDNIYGVFNSQSKSLVFVPEYTDMKATIYQYTLNGLAVNNQVVVKATYKVTPSHLAQDVADYKLMPVMFAKELKPRTRAAAEELASTNVFVTNANPNTGTFDVEAIFTYVDELDPGFGPSIAPEGWLADAAFALYLSENQAVAADGEEAPAAAPAVSNKITSSYIQVAPAKGTEIAELYVLYNPALKKEYKDLKAEELNIKMPWCEKNNARTPLAGFDVYVKNGKEYMTIAEAAELFRVPAEVITPMYFDKITYDEEECKVLAVEPDAEEEGVLARTISIVGDVTAANAKDYIGHNVAVAGNYTDVRGNDLPALDVAYSYEIDYRTVKLDLVHGDADFVAWTLDNQYALYGEDNDLTNPIDKNFDEKFGEYNVTVTQNAADKVDYKKIIESIKPTTTVKLNGVEMTTGAPALVITPVASQLAEIAAVAVSGYAFSTENENAYEFVQTYIDETSATKVEYHYALTLGQKPSKVAIDFDVEVPYATGTFSETFDLAEAVAASDFAAYLSAEQIEAGYNPQSDFGKASNTDFYIGEEVVTKTKGTTFGYINGKFDLVFDDMVKIFNAEKPAKIVRTVTTNYGVDFTYTVNITVLAPQYNLATLPMYVTADGIAYVEYTKDDKGVWTIKDADLANYFEVTGLDTKNKVQVQFTILPDEHKLGSPEFINPQGGNKYTRTTNPQANGAIAPEFNKIKWNGYPCTSVGVEAELIINEVKSGIKKNITLVAEDLITSISGAPVSVARNENAEATGDPLKGVTVNTLFEKNPINAVTFITEDTKTQVVPAAAYGASFDIKLVKVYYEVDGQPVDVKKELYTKKDGKVILSKEAATLQIPIYADFEVAILYNLNGDVDYTAEDCAKKTTVKVTFTPPTK
ncbi:MAG: hypothetical protein IJE85_00505, partial [Bacteroidales bacterium]|nr:hypothetical protein [Bacteroidales bacterium]